MITPLSYIIIFLLLIVVVFFLLRTVVIAFSMITEVPYLPSNKFYKKAIEYLKIKNGDQVLDIGSGDGRVLFFASKKYPGARFVGIERNLLLVVYSMIIKTILGRKNLDFIHVNAHNFSIIEYNKIYLFLQPTFTDQFLCDKFEEIREGSILVSLHFRFGKNFATINNITKYRVKYGSKEENIYQFIKK